MAAYPVIHQLQTVWRCFKFVVARNSRIGCGDSCLSQELQQSLGGGISSYLQNISMSACCTVPSSVLLLVIGICVSPGRWRAHHGHRHLWSCFGAWPRAPFGAKALAYSWVQLGYAGMVYKHPQKYASHWRLSDAFMFLSSPKSIITWERNLNWVWSLRSFGWRGKALDQQDIKRRQDNQISDDKIYFVQTGKICAS